MLFLKIMFCNFGKIFGIVLGQTTDRGRSIALVVLAELYSHFEWCAPGEEQMDMKYIL